MRHYVLGREERISKGFTDLYVLNGSEFSVTNATGKTLTIETLALGDMVMNNALLEVRTNLAGAGITLGEATVFAGATVLFNAVSLLPAGVKYYAPLASVPPHVVTASLTLAFGIAFDPAPGAFEVTAGEFWLWLSISRRKDRNLQV